MFRVKSHGFGWLGFTLVVFVIALLQNGLMKDEQETENRAVELVIHSLRSSLKIKMALMMVESKAYRWGELVSENPFDWVDKKPGNYCGVVDEASNSDLGCWVYDQANCLIIYRFHGGVATVKLKLRAIYAEPETSSDRPAETVVLERITP